MSLTANREPVPGIVHGYSGYKTSGCKCDECRGAQRAYSNRRRDMIRRGTWRPFVHPDRARAHVALLRQAGMGSRRIAELSGVSRATVQKLGGALADRQPTRLQTLTQTLLLSVTYDPSQALLVDSAPTWRRIEALCAIGYPKRELVLEFGLAERRALQIARGPRVWQRTAATVRATFERLEHTTGPSEQVRRQAAHKGWMPPEHWADIENGTSWDDVEPARADGMDPLLLDDIDLVVRRGETIPDVYDLLGITPGTAELRAVRLQWVEDLTRAGRSQLETGERLGLDPRQIARDLTTLRAMGVEVASGRHGGVHVDNELLEQRQRAS